MALYQKQLSGAGAAPLEAGIRYDLTYMSESSGVDTPEYWPESRYSYEDLMLAVSTHAEHAGPGGHGFRLGQTHLQGNHIIACPAMQSPGSADVTADSMTCSTSACSEQGSSSSDTKSVNKKPIGSNRKQQGKAAVETVLYDMEVVQKPQRPPKPGLMRMPGNMKLAYNEQLSLKYDCTIEKKPGSIMNQQQQQQRQQQQQSQHQTQPATVVLPKAVCVDLSRLRLKK